MPGSEFSPQEGVQWKLKHQGPETRFNTHLNLETGSEGYWDYTNTLSPPTTSEANAANHKHARSGSSTTHSP
jgi:hypothetical protein